MAVASNPATRPMKSDVRVPYISCVNTSRPKLSVPSQAVEDGGS